MSHTDDIDDSSAPLIEHLAELRNRLIHCVVAFLIGMVICFTVATPIFNFLTAPLCQVLSERGQDCGLIFISPQEGFFVAIKVSLLGGFILAFPYIGMQMWRFIAPGLYKSEKGAFLPFLIASPFMFILGASFAFYVVTPLAYDFFLGFQQFGNVGWDLPTSVRSAAAGRPWDGKPAGPRSTSRGVTRTGPSNGGADAARARCR